MTTKRGLRQEQFQKSPHGSSLSHAVAYSGQGALQLALDDRRRPVVRSQHNHYAENATGAIVLAVTALDVAVNEAIAILHTFGRVDRRDLVKDTSYEKIVALANSADTAFRTELRALIDIRDEIVHYLPRQVEGNIPSWFRVLADKGLFITTAGHQPVDFQFPHKITTYALAYWAWETGERALAAVLDDLPSTVRNVCEYVLLNFKNYCSIRHPMDLPAYDAEHGLKLTDDDAT